MGQQRGPAGRVSTPRATASPSVSNRSIWPGWQSMPDGNTIGRVFSGSLPRHGLGRGAGIAEDELAGIAFLNGAEEDCPSQSPISSSEPMGLLRQIVIGHRQQGIEAAG